MEKLEKRELVSFDGACPYKCKHCYTFGLNEENKNLSIDDIVEILKEKEFDVIYVSHNKENFINPKEGINLCRKLFETYNKDILAITRNVFNDDELNDFSKLKEEMKSKGKLLCLAVSIPALDSIEITEGIGIIPSPEERINFLKRAKEKDIKTILVIRPLYPNKIIPIKEPLKIIEKCSGFIDCVLSSGLAVNDFILKQLGLTWDDFNYLDGDNSKFLLGAIDNMKYIDVQEELKQLKDKCKELNISIFNHSMDALNYLKEIDIDYIKKTLVLNNKVFYFEKNIDKQVYVKYNCNIKTRGSESMKMLYVDFDGVVLDTILILYERAQKEGYDVNDAEFYKNFNYKEILKDKYIINDGINCIQRIIESEKFEVSILTHCHSIKEGSDKVKYIRKFFKDITVIICPKDISKTKMVHTEGAILIDDYAGNLKEWETAGGIPIKFSQELKGKGYTVIDKLDKIIDMF